MENILFSANTHTGIRRKENQDAAIIRQLRPYDKTLAAVIDGVGGYAGGERAAAIAKDCIEQYMQLPSGDTVTMLREAVVFANNQVAAERKKDQRYSEMCCVLTAMVADTLAQRIHFVHVGDTRLYRYRDGKLQKLTHDHSFVGIREDAGEIAEKEAMAHPLRNQILREVGSAMHRLDDEDFMDYGSDALVPGDLLLLCSDGLTDMITSQQLTGVLSAHQPLADKTNKLIDLANQAGGHDNITVVLLQYPAAIAAAKKPNAPVAVITGVPGAAIPTHPVKSTQWMKTMLMPAFLLLIAVTAAGWYFTTPVNKPVPGNNHVVTTLPADSMQADSNHTKPAGRASHPAVAGPEETGKADTLRISSTQNLADLKKYTDSTGKLLVLVPEYPAKNHFSAIAITGRSAKPGDTVTASNLRVKGFDNGIDVYLPILLKTDNLSFENTPHPFRYLFKPDEKHAAIILMNSAK